MSRRKPPQVIMYLRNERQKNLVQYVAQELGMHDAELLRAVALPAVKKLAVLLKRGVSPERLREELEERVREFSYMTGLTSWIVYASINMHETGPSRRGP